MSKSPSYQYLFSVCTGEVCDTTKESEREFLENNGGWACCVFISEKAYRMARRKEKKR